VRALSVGLPALTAASVLTAPSAHAAYRATFPFHDSEWLSPRESNGGAALVPSIVPVGARVPLVVFLHGVNMEMALHAWSGGRGSPDLSLVADELVQSHAARPFIFAAPSETQHAWSGRKMWGAFDVDELADDVDRALAGRAFVARDVVVVMGHSGAGCNPDGGLLYSASHPGKIAVRAFVAIDTCMDAEAASSLALAPASARVLVRWQPDMWFRPVDEFRSTFLSIATERKRPDAIMDVVRGLGKDPHAAMAENTMRVALPKLLDDLNASDASAKR
jgi:hypothetical protein